MPEPRRTFGPVVALGVGSGALTAVASSQTWLDYASADQRALDAAIPGGDAGQMPLATALTMVVLACWGVLLVTRGVVRRVMAVLGFLGSVGVVSVVVSAWWILPGQRSEPTAVGPAADMAGLSWTGWYWAAAVGALVAVVATTLAVRWVRAWPEMGSRYDAPGAGPVDDPESSLDMWKALDEGRDPTQ